MCKGKGREKVPRDSVMLTMDDAYELFFFFKREPQKKSCRATNSFENSPLL